MKRTAIAVVLSGTVTVASAACSFPVPQSLQQKGLRMDSFSCDVSESCCHGLQDGEQVAINAKGLGKGLDGKGKGQGKGPDGKGKGDGGKGRLMKDLSGTCGRADQVDLYKCAVATLPKLVPKGKGKEMTAMIKGKGCKNVAAKTGTDGSGMCAINKGKGKGAMVIGIDGVSTGCCDAANAAANAANPEAGHEAQCGMIGACGKKDQLSVMKVAKGMMGMGKGKGGGPQPGELELLETFDMTDGGAEQMMATFMTSEAEDDVAEDGATEDGSQIVTGLLGFVAGAAVTGLAVTVLRRRTPPSQYEYNEIVA